MKPRSSFFPGCATTICAILFLAAVARCLSVAIYPDETAFLGIISVWRPGHWGDIIPPNYLGYGSLWWSALHLINGLWSPTLLTVSIPEALPPLSPPFSIGWDPRFFGAIWTARLLSIIAVFGAIGHALAHAADAKSRFAVLAFLSMPIIWWNGRIASPDLISVAAAIVIATELFRGNWIRALFWLGFASGMKLSNAAILCGFTVVASAGGFRQSGIRSAVSGFGGYLVANPYILINPIQAMAFAKGIAPHHEFTWYSAMPLIESMLTGNRLEWDVVSVGSLLFWLGSPLVGIFIAFTVTITGMAPILYAAVSGLIAGLAAIVFRNLGYGWYFMPLIATFFVFAGLSFARARGAASFVAGGFLLVGVAFSISASLSETKINIDRALSIQSAFRQGDCIAASLPKLEPGAFLHIHSDPVVMPPGVRPSDKNLLLLSSLLKSHGGRDYEPGRDALIVSRAMVKHSAFVRANFEKGIGVGRVSVCGRISIISPH